MSRFSINYLELTAVLLFISLGYWIGTSLSLGKPVEAETIVKQDFASPLAALPDGERILLLVGVDQINNPQPHLKSLWLLTYYLDKQPVQFLPVYPSGDGSNEQFEAQLIDAFSLIRSGDVSQLNPSFLKLLTNHNYWLSGYIILDDEATAHIINLLGGLPTENARLSGEQILRSMPDSAKQPISAIHHQATLLGQACITITQLPQQPDWSMALELIKDHIVSDLHPLRLVSEIQLVSSNLSVLRCEFPIHLSPP